MNMQDKEIDELFRSKLEDLAVEPSKGLWDNIAAEVTVNKRRRAALPFIGIAASILLLIIAGVVFLKPGAKPGRPVQAVAYRARLQRAMVSRPTIRPTVVNMQNSIAVMVPKAIVKRRKKENLSIVKQVDTLPVVTAGATFKQQPLPDVKKEPEVIANAEPPAQSFINTDVKVATKISSQPTVAVVPAQLQRIKASTTARPKKRGISTFGDLINAVVAKVDKRKDKLIEFSSRDEDESLITGVNLGIVKVKKEEVIATNK